MLRALCMEAILLSLFADGHSKAGAGQGHVQGNCPRTGGASWCGSGCGFWLLSPHPHLSLGSLLFFSERPLAPGPLGCLLQLAPITVPDRSPGPCGDKVPWAPCSGEWRAMCRSTIEGGWCQDELVWPVFPPLVASGGSGGAEWARCGGGREGCVVSSQPCPGPTSQLSLTWLSGTLSLTTSQGRKTSGW